MLTKLGSTVHACTYTGKDYIFNGGITNGIVFPADVSTLELQLEILDDSTIEDDESVTVVFNGAVDVPGLDIVIMPPSITVTISDNDGTFQHNYKIVTYFSHAQL